MRHTDRQKEFVKTFDRISRNRSRWEAWRDMVWMFATSISNPVDPMHREQREKAYMESVSRYDAPTVQIFAELFGQLILALEEDPFQDFLGDIFMTLELSNHWHGQFFTPYSVCRAMAEISMQDAKAMVEEQGYITICDPACGAGATLIAAAETMFKGDMNYQSTAIFVGQDIDSTVGLMCYIQLSLIGCPGYIKIGNSLTEPMTGHPLFGGSGENIWYMPLYFTEIWHQRRRIAQLLSLLKPLEAGSDATTPPSAPAVIEVSGKQRGRKQAKGQLMLAI